MAGNVFSKSPLEAALSRAHAARPVPQAIQPPAATAARTISQSEPLATDADTYTVGLWKSTGVEPHIVKAVSEFAGIDIAQNPRVAERAAQIVAEGRAKGLNDMQALAGIFPGGQIPEGAAEMILGRASEFEQESAANSSVTSDVARSGAAGLVQGVGSLVRGIGEATRMTTAPLDALFGQENVNAQAPLANDIAQYASSVRDGISFEGQKAVVGSTPDGDLFKPSTWSFGEDGSIRGYAMLTADVLGSMAPVIAASLTPAGTVGGAVVGGLQGGGGGAEQARQVIDQMAQDGTLEQESTYYREAIRNGMSPGEAKEATAQAAERMGFLMTLPVSALGGAATGKLLDPGTKILASRGIGTRVAGRAALGAAEEGTQEAAETVAARTGANVGAVADQPVMEGTFGDFVLGALGGGPVGAAGGALSQREAPSAAPGEAPPPDQGAAPADPAQPAGPALPAPSAPAAAIEGPADVPALPSPADGGTIIPEGQGYAVTPPPNPDFRGTMERRTGPIGRAAAKGPAPIMPDTKPGDVVTIESEGLDPIEATVVGETADGLRIHSVQGEELDIPREEIEAGVTSIRPGKISEQGEIIEGTLAGQEPAQNIPENIPDAPHPALERGPVQTEMEILPPQTAPEVIPAPQPAPERPAVQSPVEVAPRQETEAKRAYDTPEEIRARIDYLNQQGRSNGWRGIMAAQKAALEERLAEMEAPAAATQEESPPAPSFPVENIRGKAAVIRGATKDDAQRISALPGLEKVKLIHDPKAGGLIFARKHADTVRAALKGSEAPSATKSETKADPSTEPAKSVESKPERRPSPPQIPPLHGMAPLGAAPAAEAKPEPAGKPEIDLAAVSRKPATSLNDAEKRAQLARLEGKKYKTAGDEKTIGLLKARLDADPAKWNPGDGVGYRVGPAGKGGQINRGFRVVSVDPETRTAVVRQVADTGLTSSGGNNDRFADTTVHLADLVRDKKHDARKPKGEAAAPAAEKNTLDDLDRETTGFNDWMAARGWKNWVVMRRRTGPGVDRYRARLVEPESLKVVTPKEYKALEAEFEAWKAQKSEMESRKAPSGTALAEKPKAAKPARETKLSTLPEASEDGTSEIPVEGFASKEDLRDSLTEGEFGEPIGRLIDSGMVVLHDTVESVPGLSDAISKASRFPKNAPVANLDEKIAAVRPEDPGRYPIVVGAAPEVLLALGAPNDPVIISQGVVAKAVAKHGLDLEQVKTALHQMYDPVMVFDSAPQSDSPDNSMVIAVELQSDDHPVTIAVHFERSAGNTKITNVASINVRRASQIANWIEQGLVRYSGRKADAWLSRLKLQSLRAVVQRHRLGRKILRYADVFKPKASSFSLDRIQGLTTPDGTIHLVAANLNDRTAVPVLLHEMFHSGAEPLIGSKTFQNLLSRVKTIMDRNAANESEWWARARKRMEQSGGPASAEEFAAYAIEERAGAMPGLREAAEKLLGRFKAFMLRRFGKQIGEVTPAQLQAIAVAALRTGAQVRSRGLYLPKDGSPEGRRGEDMPRNAGDSKGRRHSVSPSEDGGKRARSFGIPEAAAAPIAPFTSAADIQSHPSYKAAKGGDGIAAVRLVHDLFPIGRVRQAGRRFGKDVIYAPVSAFEASGTNKIPNAIALYLAEETGAEHNSDILQANRAYHTGAKAMERLIARAHFAGAVSKGKRYVIVDDVSVMGSTVADMAGYIRQNGGEVAGVVLLANAGRNATFAPKPSKIGAIRRRFGDAIGSLFSVEPESLTANEADYILNFRDADALGTRVARARDERINRLDAKGIRADQAGAPGEVKFSIASAIPSARAFAAAEKNILSQTLTQAMAGKGGTNLLALVPGRALFAELAKNMPAAQEYLRIKGNMDTLRNTWHERMDKTAQEWRKQIAKHGAANEDLMDIMHESTLHGVDPSLPAFKSRLSNFDRQVLDNPKAKGDALRIAQKNQEADEKRRRAYDRLRERYKALPADLQRIYTTVRDEFKALNDEFETTLMDNIGKAMDLGVRKAERDHAKEVQRIVDEGLAGEEAREARAKADRKLGGIKRRLGWNRRAKMADMRAKFETQKGPDPYFPLARFGQFFVTARDKETGEIVSFSRFESVRDRDREVKLLQRDGYKVEVGALGEDVQAKDMVDPTFVGDVEAILHDAGVDERVMDQVWQRWLETLPDLSLRKNRIHRKGTAGWNRDAFRAFGHHMFHGSHQLARLKYSMDLDEALRITEEQAKSQSDPTRAGLVVEEMKRRHGFTMKPTGSAWAQRLTSAAFFYYLAVTPAAALVNLTQTSVVGTSILGAYQGAHGIRVATRQLGNALKDFAKGRGDIAKADLTDDERAAVREAYDRGTIDKSQAHDLAGVGETGVEYSARWSKVGKILSWTFHHTERANREITFLAAYRMARNKGLDHTKSVDKAAELTWKTHFDYQSSSKPRFMQQDWTRVIFTFRNFTVNMIWRLFRDTHQALRGASAEERAEARRQLVGISAMLMMHAGARGVWGYTLITMLAAAFFPGDADDMDDELQKAVTGLFGNQIGGAILNGIPGHALGIDLTARIGMPDLWFRSPDRHLEGKDEYLYWVEQMLGPTFAMIGNGFMGLSMIGDGEVQRGVEYLMPKALKDLSKAERFLTEGATTYRGDPILDDMPPQDILKQAIGFTPAELSEQYDRNRLMKNREQRISDERSRILADYTRALRNGEKPPQSVIDRMTEFNRAHPTWAIGTDTIKRSLSSRIRASEAMDGGISLNQKIERQIRESVSPPIYQ